MLAILRQKLAQSCQGTRSLQALRVQRPRQDQDLIGLVIQPNRLMRTVNVRSLQADLVLRLCYGLPKFTDRSGDFVICCVAFDTSIQ